MFSYFDNNFWFDVLYKSTPLLVLTLILLAVGRVLLKAGADVGAQDNDKWTPLHAAAHWGQTESCEILAQNFASFKALDSAVCAHQPVISAHTLPVYFINFFPFSGVNNCLQCFDWLISASLSLAPVKSRLVLPFWYRLTRVVPDKRPLNGCVCVCVCFDWLVGWQEGHPACKKTVWCGAGVVICLEQGADLHMAQLMPLSLA